MTHCLTDYLNFCVDLVAPTKTVQCYSNNKPWVTQRVKAILNKKKKALRTKDKKMKAAQREVKYCLREATDSYREKVEQCIFTQAAHQHPPPLLTPDACSDPPSCSPSLTSPQIFLSSLPHQLYLHAPPPIPWHLSSLPHLPPPTFLTASSLHLS